MQSISTYEAQERTIAIVTAEIKTIKQQAQRIMLSAAIEIGRRLVEAKEMLPHGAWGDWLKNEVEFSQRTATNLMRLYREYGDKQQTLFGAELSSNWQTFADLPFSKALALLAIPEDERDDFIEDIDIDGISVRELQEKIAQYEAEKASLQAQLESAKAEAQDYREQYQAEWDKNEELGNKLEELEEKLAEQEPDPEIIKAAEEIARKEAETEITKKLANEHKKQLEEASKTYKEEIKGLKAKIKELEESAKAAPDVNPEEIAKKDAEIEAYKAQLAAVEKKMKLASNPQLVRFQTLFEIMAKDFEAILQCITTLKDTGDTENAQKFSIALTKAMNTWLDRLD